ncbi:carboxypeptidase-like regulatory domain-containing protein, partial [Chitinophaga sp.]|uniref:carboxypeptidase-like regulatory domain-containing protein n=1 Tax=Chitinophaga sp. TaxID=1869181 RepID=UPI002F94780C
MKKRLRIRDLIRKVILAGPCLHLTVWLLLSALMAHAAPTDITISGKVTDDQGSALPGVTVSVKGTAKGTSTNSNGTYHLAVADKNAVLVFSFVGYVKQEITVGEKTDINVQLVTDSKGLG